MTKQLAQYQKSVVKLTAEKTQDQNAINELTKKHWQTISGVTTQYQAQIAEILATKKKAESEANILRTLNSEQQTRIAALTNEIRDLKQNTDGQILSLRESLKSISSTI